LRLLHSALSDTKELDNSIAHEMRSSSTMNSH
jgi:hypothetical protein